MRCGALSMCDDISNSPAPPPASKCDGISICDAISQTLTSENVIGNDPVVKVRGQLYRVGNGFAKW